MKNSIIRFVGISGLMILGIALPSTASADHNMSLLVQGGAGGTGPMNLNICFKSSGCSDEKKSPEGGVLQLGGGYTYTHKYLRVSARLEGGVVFGEDDKYGGYTWGVGTVGLHTRWIFAEAGGGVGISIARDEVSPVFPAQARLGVRILENLAIVGTATVAFGPKHIAGFFGAGLEWSI